MSNCLYGIALYFTKLGFLSWSLLLFPTRLAAADAAHIIHSNHVALRRAGLSYDAYVSALAPIFASAVDCVTDIPADHLRSNGLPYPTFTIYSVEDATPTMVNIICPSCPPFPVDGMGPADYLQPSS